MAISMLLKGLVLDIMELLELSHMALLDITQLLGMLLLQLLNQSASSSTEMVDIALSYSDFSLDCVTSC